MLVSVCNFLHLLNAFAIFLYLHVYICLERNF